MLSENIPETKTNIIETPATIYLIRQRVENLREKIGLTFQEVEELQELEGIIDDNDDIASDIGEANRNEKFIASLEAKRVNREEMNTWDDINEAESSINTFYQKLFTESVLNLKSFVFLNEHQKEIIKYKNQKLSLFDVYELGASKLSFSKFLSYYLKVPEELVYKKLEKLSGAKQWELKERWETYQKDRENKNTSSFQQVLRRCMDTITSPIYDNMNEISPEEYQLQNACRLRFTDKTALFTIPITEFHDIEKKRLSLSIKYIQFATVLPEYAWERQYFYKKDNDLKSFQQFLNILGMDLSLKQMEFLKEMIMFKSLFLYREALQFPDRDEVKGYFLYIRSGFRGYSQYRIQKFLLDKFDKEEHIITNLVHSKAYWLPEWMRKLSGFTIEAKSGNRIVIAKPLQIAVDEKLSKRSYKWDNFLIPSERIFKAPKDEFRGKFVAEMRAKYHYNSEKFEQYARDFAEGKIELKCSCEENHHEKCLVPVLEEIFKKISSK